MATWSDLWDLFDNNDDDEEEGGSTTGSYTRSNFPYQQYAQSINYNYGDNLGWSDKEDLWRYFQRTGSSWTPTPTTPTPDPNNPPQPPTAPQDATVVAGNANAQAGQINVTDYAGQLVNNPSLGFTGDNPATDANESMSLSDRVPTIDPNTPGTNINGSSPTYGPQATPTQNLSQGTATGVGGVDPQQAQSYNAQITQANVEQNAQSTAAQGQVSQGAQINAPQLDMQGTGTGVNADGSTNYTGQALQQAATQNISNIIDTSTPAGKALAQQLGEGNYVDSKATLQGQLQMLQSQFVGPNGEPKIPVWAAATARNVSKIAAFRGLSGTAATAAMAQALMEASIPVAEQDAKFFQTVTLENLSNRQAATINRANVLAKFDLTNIDNRMAAAVENSKAFLQMDLANLDNRQQSELLNTQARVQSILEDAKSINAARLFSAEEANNMNKFYESLNASIAQFTASQKNSMEQFNVNEANGMERYYQDLENNREQFYKTMQYNIDLANAKWRQDITMEEADMTFQAAATDVKNMVDLSTEQLNQIWDRSDALLDYLWKSTENDLQRKNDLLIAKTSARASVDAADAAGKGSIFGTIIGAGASKLFDWIF